VKSIIDLPAGECRVLEKDIVDCPASCVVEGLNTEAVISTRGFGRSLWGMHVN
jgi:hypothetical protein